MSLQIGVSTPLADASWEKSSSFFLMSVRLSLDGIFRVSDLLEATRLQPLN